MQTRLRLTARDHGRPLTYEEFIGADYQEGYRYELIAGRLYVSPRPNVSHNAFENWLWRILDDYAREHPEVVEYVAPQPSVFLPEREEGVTAPEPDFACYAEFAEDPYARGVNWRDYSPFLVVEILSEDSADKDLERNRRLYLRVPSIQEYWIVDPRRGAEGVSMLVYRRRGRRWAACRTVGAGETYETPLLPGFSLLLDPRAH